MSKVSSLARLLRCTEGRLLDTAGRVEELHKVGAIQRKKDGSPRPTHDARPQLKAIHETIKNRLLQTVDFPPYLLGGIKDKNYPRTPDAHARIHAARGIIISEDIKDFYPSTTRDQVYKIWKYLFQFSHDVADILADLTTYDTALPQGWKTSGYLANLTLWEREPELVAWLRKIDCTYSRFADDIDISSNQHLNDATKTKIIARVYGMLAASGYNPKRQKHKIMTPGSLMEVTGLQVNRQRLTLSKNYRNAVRSQVFKLERRASIEWHTKDFCKEWRSAMGKVSYIREYHPQVAQKLRARLSAIKPPKHLLAKKQP